MHLGAEAATLIGEEEGPVVRVRNLERLHRILFTRGHAAHALPAAMLLAVGGEWLTLDVTATTDRDHHILIRNKVFIRHLTGGVLRNAGAALVAELLLQLGVLRGDDLGDALRIGKDVFELLDQPKDFQILVFNLLALKCGKPGEAHVQDCLRLQFAELELRHQLFARNVNICGGADRLDHGIKVVQRNLQSFQDVRALARLLQIKLGAASDDDAAVLNVVLQDGLQRQRLWLAVNECEHVHAECGAEWGELQQLVEHLVRIPVALHFNVYTHPVAVGFVAKIGDAVNAALLYQVGDLLNE